MQYRNVFMEIGKTEEEIKSKLQEVIHNFFYGEDKVYFPVGDDMAYIEEHPGAGASQPHPGQKPKHRDTWQTSLTASSHNMR